MMKIKFFIWLLFHYMNRAFGITFQTEALKQKTTCAQLTRNECIFYEEAQSQCSTECKQKISGKDEQDNQNIKTNKKPPRPKKKGCFHGDDEVYTLTGPVKLRDLVMKPDVEVLSRDDFGRMTYSPIYYWIHAKQGVFGEFMNLRLESGHELHITKDHLIYETDEFGYNQKTIFAGRLNVGSFVHVVNKNNTFTASKVLSKQTVRKQGIYSPITRQGNIIVNNVLASCFVCLENEALQKIMYSYMNLIHQLFSMVLPRTILQTFYSDSFGYSITVPEVVFSFWDLGKVFVK